MLFEKMLKAEYYTQIQVLAIYRDLQKISPDS